MKIKAILPEKPDLGPERLQIQAFLKKESNRDLVKVLVFINNMQPVCEPELKRKLNKHYNGFDKIKLYQIFAQLKGEGLISFKKIKNLVDKNEHTKTEIGKEIYKVHQEYLKKRIPEQFRNRYYHMNYYFLTKFGGEFVEFCCKVLGLKYEKEE